MVRFVVGPGSTLLPDLAERLPGRGIWLSAEGDVIETARASSRLARAVARAAGGPVSVPVDLLMRLEAGLVQRIAELLSVARRAGQVVAGQEQVRIWLAGGFVGLWLDAGEGNLPPEGLPREAVGPPFVRVPPAVLGGAFGHLRAGPVAMRHGRLAEAVRNEAGRLAAVGYGWSNAGGGGRVHDGRQ